WIKHAIVVNKDVDIDDPNEVNWAIMTRANMAEDLVLVKSIWGFVMDPSRKSKEEPVTKMGIDATVDPADRDRCLKTDVTNYGACDLRNYLTDMQ
ncbi:MAG TPA: UbiD family decarboxylase, partial [Thermodesulfobacteriota bacterium]|nr:UbiD family decarboxylase [Thermodesulfobacteriota bacterium]